MLNNEKVQVISKTRALSEKIFDVVSNKGSLPQEDFNNVVHYTAYLSAFRKTSEGFNTTNFDAFGNIIEAIDKEDYFRVDSLVRKHHSYIVKLLGVECEGKAFFSEADKTEITQLFDSLLQSLSVDKKAVDVEPESIPLQKATPQYTPDEEIPAHVHVDAEPRGGLLSRLYRQIVG